MKKWILTMCLVVFLLPVGGCWETFALIGGGAAGGMTITRMLDQQQKIIQEDIEMMEAEKAELEQELAEATTEAEKERIQKQLKNVDIVLADLRVANETIAKTKEGLNVDWKDPQSVIPFTMAIVLAILAERERRKKKKVTIALEEVVEGGQEFKRSLIGAENTIDKFKAAHRNKQSTETKKLVATMKA